MSDKIREAFDAWIASVDKRRDANGWEPLTARDVNMLREGYMEAALAQQPATAVPEGWKLVPAVPTQEQNDAGRSALAGGAVPMAKVYRAMLAAAPSAPVAQEPGEDWDGEVYIGSRTPKFSAPPAAQQSDTVPVPRELYTCIGKGGTYELIGKSQGAGELKHQQLVVYRSAGTGLLFHRTLDDFDARMALLAGGAE